MATYNGLGVPLYGESQIVQQTAADTILSVKGANGQTGDFFTAVDSTSTERFAVEDGGNVVVTQKAAGDIGIKLLRASGPTASAISVQDNGGAAQWSVTKNYGILWKVRTTRPTTGLTKGEMFIAFHGSSPKICICTSTAAQTVKQVRARTKTFGRLTA